MSNEPVPHICCVLIGADLNLRRKGRAMPQSQRLMRPVSGQSKDEKPGVAGDEDS